MNGSTQWKPRVLISAPSVRVAEIAKAVRDLGADAIEAPVVSTASLEDPAVLDAALHPRRPYDWVVFTSARGVDAVAARLAVIGQPPSAVASRTAAVGPATAAAAEKAGFPVSAVPEHFVSDEVAGVLGNVRGLHVLLPRADRARRSLAEALSAAGATVLSVDAYRTVPVALPLDSSRAQTADLVVFTSAAAVEFLGASLGSRAWRSLTDVGLACCIGPVTATAAQDAGFSRVRVADPHTAPGLLRLVAEEVANLG